MRRVTVIANCHCLPIAQALALGSDGLEVSFIDVNFIEHSPFKERVQALINEDDGSNLVFSFSFHDKWDSISTINLRSIYNERLFTFTNIHFSGLFPDITYMGRMGNRTVGLMRDYHSKLVLYGVAAGRTIEDTIDLFKGERFKELGFYDAYEASKRELRLRDEAVDVKFAEELFSIVEREPAMLTVNHPTDATLQILCRRLCERAGLPFAPSPPGFLMNSLADNCIWPVYDALAEHHGLLYRTPQRFIRPNDSVSRGMDLPTFVKYSYSDYLCSPAGEIKAAVEALPFYKDFRAILD